MGLHPEITDIAKVSDVEYTNSLIIVPVASNIQKTICICQAPIGVTGLGKIDVPEIVTIALSENPYLVVAPSQCINIRVITADTGGSRPNVKTPYLAAASFLPLANVTPSPVSGVISAVLIAPELHYVIPTAIERALAVMVHVVSVYGGARPLGIPVFIELGTVAAAVGMVFESVFLGV